MGVKLFILLKGIQTALQFKFLLISAGGLAIQAVKFWMALRNKKDDHHEEIVYKNPYGAGEEYSSPGGAPYGGDYHGRSFDGQNLAYSQQVPAAM